jgi:hypothetical protein
MDRRIAVRAQPTVLETRLISLKFFFVFGVAAAAAAAIGCLKLEPFGLELNPPATTLVRVELGVTFLLLLKLFMRL